jgi:hypothetical protein
MASQAALLGEVPSEFKWGITADRMGFLVEGFKTNLSAKP